MARISDERLAEMLAQREHWNISGGRSEECPCEFCGVRLDLQDARTQLRIAKEALEQTAAIRVNEKGWFITSDFISIARKALEKLSG